MTKKNSFFWYNSALVARVIGFILFFAPGIFLLAWGLLEMNQDHEMVFLSLGGLLLCFTFIRLSMPAEGYYCEADQLVVWRGYNLLFTHWKSHYRTLPADTLKWQVQSFRPANTHWEVKSPVVYRLQVWSKTNRSSKKWHFHRFFEDRKQAREFSALLQEHIKSCAKHHL